MVKLSRRLPSGKIEGVVAVAAGRVRVVEVIALDGRSDSTGPVVHDLHGVLIDQRQFAVGETEMAVGRPVLIGEEPSAPVAEVDMRAWSIVNEVKFVFVLLSTTAFDCDDCQLKTRELLSNELMPVMFSARQPLPEPKPSPPAAGLELPG